MKFSLMKTYYTCTISSKEVNKFEKISKIYISCLKRVSLHKMYMSHKIQCHLSAGHPDS